MEQGELIDRMCADMYVIASKVDYGFAQFAMPWGPKSKDPYFRKKMAFNRSIEKFAKNCGVMALGNQFYFFNGKIYEKVTEFAVCMAYDKLMMKLGIGCEYAVSKTTRKDLFLNNIIAYNQLHVRNDVIAFSNKVVDLRRANSDSASGTHKFGPEWHVIDYHDYPYQPEAKAPFFMKFLDRVLPDKRQRDILQMFLGLGLIQAQDAFNKNAGGPRGTVELCLILLGSGANGKSVLFNIMCALFGKQHITSVDYETMTAEGDEGMRGRATIRSALFNWSSDSDARKFGQKNTHIFKKIISGEPFQYRLLGQDVETSHTCPYLIFSLNQLPTSIMDGSRGMLRRLQFVNFEVTIPKTQQDPNLAYKIIQSDLPGIFNWVLRGAKEIRRRNFCFPSSDASLKTKVRALLPASPVTAWTIAYGIRAEALAPLEVPTAFKLELMYDSYKSFCENNDAEEVMTQNKFSRCLGKMGFDKKRRADGYYFNTYGITEKYLRTPLMLDMLKDTEADRAAKYETDGKSFIQND